MVGELPVRADVVVVGAGPAGLAAATWLRRQGVGRVLVLDREAAAGGIPRHCGHFPYGLREFRRLMRGPDYAARLFREARAAGADIRTRVTVLALGPGPTLRVSSDAGLGEVAADRVLLATGVRETPRAARLIGGTKPGGVLTTGALQGLVYLDGLRPFRTPVILGTELVAFSALLTCRHLGIRPAAMIEPGPRPTARWPAGLLPGLLRIPVLCNTTIAGIEGVDRVTGVVLRSASGEESRMSADGVIVTGQFRPEATLMLASHLDTDPGTGGPVVDEFGRCSDPTYFAAGNLLRPVETAGVSWAEGRAVARSIRRSLEGGLPAAGAGVCLRLEGDALKYVMPQRVVSGRDEPALPALQLRLGRAARGRLVLSRAGAELSSRRIDSLPERRILLPLPRGEGLVTIRLEEEAT
jgi:thioredoxin reductase